MIFRRRYTVNPDDPARALAAHMLRTYEIDTLEPTAAVQFLRTRYMRAVAEWGLPANACNDVAERAWKLVCATRRTPQVDQRTGFAFYD